ncbi:hypothetical protein [Enterobacter kobei]
MSNAGFIDCMLVKIRVMKDCIVIPPEHPRAVGLCRRFKRRPLQ